MSKVSFSVPKAVKEAFNEAFKGEDKDAIVAALMREALDRVEHRRQGQDAFKRILARRHVGPKFSDEEIAAARDAGRP